MDTESAEFQANYIAVRRSRAEWHYFKKPTKVQGMVLLMPGASFETGHKWVEEDRHGNDRPMKLVLEFVGKEELWLA